MTHAFMTLTDRFVRLRARTVAPVEKRTRLRAIDRLSVRLPGRRANPQLLVAADDEGLIARLRIGWHNRRMRRRWQRELSALDERLLRDVGLSRAETERIARLPCFWI